MKCFISGVEDVATIETTGLSYNIYFAGCTKKCKDCHNPDLWEQHPEQACDTEDVFEAYIKDAGVADYVCLLGGEPLDQYQAVCDLILKFRTIDVPVWLYTGWDVEEIKSIESGILYSFLIENCHTIKVGAYDTNYPKGDVLATSNQRFIPGQQFTV